MIYISDSEDMTPERCQASMASLGSSIAIINSSNSSSQLHPNSSGWPSLLNIASNTSLLSSYTPPDIRYAEKTDADDVDALIRQCGTCSSGDELTNTQFGKPREQRSRVGPMDIDTADPDSSWLQTPSDQPSRKRRLVGEHGAEKGDSSQPVLSTAPFMFSMPAQQPAPEPMEWEASHTATRSDNRPISPHATRRVAERRQNEPAGFAHIQNSPMVGDRRFNRRRQRRQNQQRQERAHRRRLQRHGDGGSSAWVTDSSSGSSSNSSSDNDSEGSSVVSRASGQRRRAAAAGSSRSQRSARSRRQWRRMSRGVDRALALMGSRVEEPTLTERLQMHRDIPYVISGYLQLGLNIAMVATVLVLVVQVLLTIKRDVSARVQEYSAEILHEIAACSKQYVDNRCDPLMRVPAMEQACAAWEACMHRDPTKVGRARVSAETLAEIVNGFIEPISLKTMLFFGCIFFGTLLVSNFAFGAYRHSRVHLQYVSQSADRIPPPASASRLHRKDDPLATPSPHANTAVQMLVPSSGPRRRVRPRSPSHTRTPRR
ncbi:hypothetical protein IWW36_001631 [Coemansia brasiliensis]|uniref:Brl1/Brr6 domain-containing protein n=1 Tax=Coemansia brasiliensis TaxID=2650707 RepID=A0A9W8IHH7_9FUNG|nr:hypothetical protein IWW36_001631 [Coemansia brasiliensis]